MLPQRQARQASQHAFRRAGEPPPAIPHLRPIGPPGHPCHHTCRGPKPPWPPPTHGAPHAEGQVGEEAGEEDGVAKGRVLDGCVVQPRVPQDVGARHAAHHPDGPPQPRRNLAAVGDQQRADAHEVPEQAQDEALHGGVGASNRRGRTRGDLTGPHRGRLQTAPPLRVAAMQARPPCPPLPPAIHPLTR